MSFEIPSNKHIYHSERYYDTWWDEFNRATVINVDDEGAVEIASNVTDGNTNAIVGGNIISSTSSAKFALRLDNITNPTESYALYRCC